MAKKMKTRMIAASAAGAVCLTVGSGALANAAPTLDPPKPGNSSPKLDPQTPSTPAPAAPAPAPAPVQEAPAREYVPGYVPMYADAPSKPVANYDYGQDSNYSGGGYGYYGGYSDNYSGGYTSDYTAPVEPAAVAVVEAPVKKFRFGDYIADQTDLFTPRQWNMINNTTADLETSYGNLWRSVGVDAKRSDRIAAATFGTAAAGAAIGALPGAALGALAGGTIGGNVGLTMGGVISLPLAPVPGLPAVVVVPTTVAGTAVGAAAGAAVGGAITAVPGALIGAAIGTAAGAGDDYPDPIEFELPSRPKVDTEAVTAQTQQAVQQVESLPGGTGIVETVRNAADEAPKVSAAIDTAVRDAVASVPGGSDAIAAVDTFNSNASMFTEPITTPIHDALAAAHTGLFG
ncbi:hypothetical protein GS966_27720 [Rhodococcus hoagii]|nr:hypothetical protein [Prescottella equi]NKR28899.1 hypothetical protein [Prescottella equi]NKR30295.1 hypothetical protein [Prescottella equi]NKS10224.1 hypothetical protein [Prescottella equi]NKS35215.1 hypothetical protein [Prescottella equi]